MADFTTFTTCCTSGIRPITTTCSQMMQIQDVSRCPIRHKTVLFVFSFSGNVNTSKMFVLVDLSIVLIRLCCPLLAQMEPILNIKNVTVAALCDKRLTFINSSVQLVILQNCFFFPALHFCNHSKPCGSFQPMEQNQRCQYKTLLMQQVAKRWRTSLIQFTCSTITNA